jgi:hypothetical protein
MKGGSEKMCDDEIEHSEQRGAGDNIVVVFTLKVV